MTLRNQNKASLSVNIQVPTKNGCDWLKTTIKSHDTRAR